ncbi:MAG: hypothetical protein ACRD7E_32075 [Bryobacteraceae bacterium]
MMWELYVRKRLAYIPTMARTDAGFYLAIEPVEIVPIDDKVALEQALVKTIARGNPKVPTPTRGSFPQPVVLPHAKVKSWSTFMKGATGWSIANENGLFSIAPYRLGEHGGFEEDPEGKESFPDMAPVDSIVRRVVDRVTRTGGNWCG